MENISLSLPRRSFSSNTAFTSHKSVYDDVFGGPPKLGLPTLAPRFEDYSEIFGGFHTSQSSSIPVLHLPLLTSDDPDIHFDIDYTEVFRGCGGFNITASPEDLVAHPSGGYYSDSADDPWSPAQSGSLSDELDPVVGSDKSHRLSDGDSQQSLASMNQQNASYNKSCHMSAETVLTSISHVTNFSAVPGYTCSLYDSPVSWGREDEHCSVGVRVTREKQYEFSSKPVHSGSYIHRSDSKPVEKHGNSTSLGDKPFVTVSDISLRTKPSRLPPPSRPPPALVDKRRECDKQNSSIQPCQLYASDRVADGSAPLFFDMEIDGTISVEGRGNLNKNVKANHQGTKEPTERECFSSLSAAQVEEKTNETIRVDTDIDYENFLQSRGEKHTILLHVVEERTESTKHSEEISGPLGADCCNSNADNLAEAVAWRESTGYFEAQAEAKCDENKVEVRLRQKNSPKRTNSRFFDSQKLKETSGKHEEKILMEEFHRRFEDVEGAEMIEIVQERMIAEGTEMQHPGDSTEGAYELKENDVILKDTEKHKESGEKSSISAVTAKSADRYLDCEKDMNMGAAKMIMNELASRTVIEQAVDEKYHKLIHEMDVLEKRNQDVSKNDNELLRLRMTETQEGNVEEAFETIGNMKLSTVTCSHEELNEHADETDSIERNGHDGTEVEWELDDIVFTDGDQLKILERGYEINEVTATKILRKHDNIQMLETDRRAFSSAGNGDLRDNPDSSTYESETGTGDSLVTGRLHEFSKDKDESLDKSSQNATNNPVMSPSVPKQMSGLQVYGPGMGVSRVMSDKMSSVSGSSKGEGYKMNNARFIERVNISDDCDRQQVMKEPIASGGNIEDVSSYLKDSDDGLYPKKDATSLPTERKDSNMKGNISTEDQKEGGRIRRETVPENEHLRKMEEEWEREREREKDRMAVDKAALEARERSYFEARERSERAAVERNTAEVRKRAVAEAQERLEKASMEARLRSDRAAVERATAEARQRAAEKLMAQKAAHDPLDHVERLPDRFSDSAGSTDTRQRFLSSGIHFQGSGVSSRLRYPYPSAYNGAESESPQRCKARLERYRRTAERAANALAEKNRRDHLAQREREERNRVAESLDSEVKRWSSGKEGNLRALLSTLQYILGPDSGWHPLSLTEVITSAAVKRAYRRATLCVHPDKLQQRGATIQQKYICEKVFDLLKEAWNKFNSEER